MAELTGELRPNRRPFSQPSKDAQTDKANNAVALPQEKLPSKFQQLSLRVAELGSRAVASGYSPDGPQKFQLAKPVLHLAREIIKRIAG